MEHPLEIDVAHLRDCLERDDQLLLIDCREPDEWAIGHLESATHIPMGDIPSRYEEITADGQRDIVVYCHHGGRSLRVVRWLRGQGLSRTSSLAGGIDAWSEQIDPAIPRY